MKKLIILCSFMLWFPQVWAATIHSVAAGGDWNKAETWVGGQVPGKDDSVVVNGKVTINRDVILTDIIISIGSILTTSNYNYALTVNGNIINNGTIVDGEEQKFRVFVAGNLTNNSDWKNYRLTFNKEISKVNAPSSIDSESVYMDSDVEIVGNVVFSGKTTFNSNKKLIVNQSSIVSFGITTGISIVEGNGKIRLINTPHSYVKFDGNISEIAFTGTNQEIHGDFTANNIVFGGTGVKTLKGGTTVNGNLNISKGVLLTTSNYNYALTVNGNIINNGTIVDGEEQKFRVFVAGNLTNNSDWKNYRLTFNKEISKVNAPSSIDSESVYMDSDVEIVGNVVFSGKTTFNSNKKLIVNQSSIVSFGITTGISIVEGNGKIRLINTPHSYVKFDGNISEIAFTGTNQEIHGDFTANNIVFGGTGVKTLKGGTTVNGNLNISKGVLLTTSNYNYALTVNGNITNNGTIADGEKQQFRVFTSGNILNNGTWNNSRTTLTFPSNKFRMTNTPTWEEPKNTSSYEITDYLTTQHHWQVSADGNTWSEQRGINDPSLVVATENINFIAEPVLTNDDHGDTPFASTPISLNSNISGQMNADFDRDCFKVDVPSYGLLTVNITSDANIYALLAKITNRGGERLITEEGKNFNISQELEADSYYICLDGQQNYSFNTAFVPLQASSCNSDNCTANYSVSNEAANIPCIVAPGLGTFEAELTMIPNSNPPRLTLSGIKQVSQDCAGRPSLYLPDIGKLNIPELNIPELGDILDVTLGLFKQGEQPEFTIESVKPPLKKALQSLNGWSFKADVFDETYTYILKKFDNQFDVDGLYWQATDIAKIGSSKLITVVLQENGDLAIKHKIGEHDYTFTLQPYNNPTDPDGNYYQYVDCSKAPKYWNFFLIENPSCRQKESLFFFLNIVAPETRRLKADIIANMKGIVSAEEGLTLFNDAVDTFAGYLSLFSWKPDDTVFKTSVEIASGVTDLTAGITQTLYGGDSKITGIVVDGLGQLLSGAASGVTNPALMVDLGADFSTSVFRFALAFSLNESIERLNETIILDKYYLKYLSYGGNKRILRTSLGLPVNASLKTVVREIADNSGYTEGWLSENYKADRVIKMIDGFDEAFKQVDF